MTLAMALDNSFEIMNEDEMYDVNGGFGGWLKEKVKKLTNIFWATLLGLVASFAGTTAAKALVNTFKETKLAKSLIGGIKAAVLKPDVILGLVLIGVAAIATVWAYS